MAPVIFYVFQLFSAVSLERHAARQNARPDVGEGRCCVSYEGERERERREPIKMRRESIPKRRERDHVIFTALPMMIAVCQGL